MKRDTLYFVDKNNELKLMVPEELKQTILYDNHDASHSGHLGLQRKCAH
jgi:hypothetical protein